MAQSALPSPGAGAHRVPAVQDSLRSATARDIVVILFVSLAAHAFFLAVNFLCARYVLRLSRKHLIAVVIAGSEKTLGVSAALAGSLRPEIFGESPLLVAPGLIAHLCQLLMDSLVTVIINAFKSDVPRGRAQAAAPAPDVQEVRAGRHISWRVSCRRSLAASARAAVGGRGVHQIGASCVLSLSRHSAVRQHCTRRARVLLGARKLSG